MLDIICLIVALSVIYWAFFTDGSKSVRSFPEYPPQESEPIEQPVFQGKNRISKYFQDDVRLN